VVTLVYIATPGQQMQVDPPRLRRPSRMPGVARR